MPHKRNIFESFEHDRREVPWWVSLLLWFVWFVFWALLAAMAILALILMMGCAAKTPRVHMLPAPASCLSADIFDKPLRPDTKRGGWIGDGVHFSVKPGRECNGAQPGVVDVRGAKP